jgi:hypothetical protein
MTARERAIDAAMQAVGKFDHPDREIIAAVYDTVQPIIQGEMVEVTRACLREEILLDLRAKVEALLPTTHEHSNAALRWVLALFDEEAGERPYRCPVADRSVRFVCEYRESGGYQCERLDPHDDEEYGHWWSDHTIDHSLAGNGYACSAIAPRDEEARP